MARRPRETVNIMKQFKELRLHPAKKNKDDSDEEDYAERPFILSGKGREEHGKAIYGCCFDMFRADTDEQYLATVGDQFLHVYRFEEDSNLITPLYACEFPTDERIEKKVGRREGLFCVTWTTDEFENKRKVVCAGAFGHVYVVDAMSGTISNRLMGSGSEINDIRTNPDNWNMVATASTDLAIRVYHIRNEAPLVVIGGPKCHTGAILSLDWHVNGNYIVSCSMDHQVMQFDLSVPDVRAHLKEACEALSNGRRNQFFQRGERVIRTVPVSEATVQDDSESAVVQTAANFAKSVTNGCATIYVPSAICSDIHFDFADCVRLLPGTDLILSKSCESDSQIALWKFGPLDKTNNKGPDATERCASLIQTRKVINGQPFFVKFELDRRRRWLVCGGTEGVVSFYDMLNPQLEPHHVITAAAATVRQVSFSPCGRFMCTVSDDALVCRFDRVHKSVDKDKLKRFKDS